MLTRAIAMSLTIIGVTVCVFVNLGAILLGLVQNRRPTRLSLILIGSTLGMSL
jgi:hypothetical protein